MSRWRRIPLAPVLLGLGTGGFADGVVAHQILGWHHMLSGWYAPTTPEHLRLNMAADGYFHLLCLALVLAGVAALNRAGRLRRRVLWGGMLAGWGVFNLVEGLIDHQLLGVHHVRHGDHEVHYDLGFLALGAALLLAGALLARSTSVTGLPAPSHTEGTEGP